MISTIQDPNASWFTFYKKQMKLLIDILIKHDIKGGYKQVEGKDYAKSTKTGVDLLPLTFARQNVVPFSDELLADLKQYEKDTHNYGEITFTSKYIIFMSPTVKAYNDVFGTDLVYKDGSDGSDAPLSSDK